MSLAKGIYGIEYNPRQSERNSSGLGWVLLVVAAVALVSLAVTLVRRFGSEDPEAVPEPLVVERTDAAERPPAVAGTPPPEPDPAPAVARDLSLERRPVRVRNLLMRLEEAERSHDVELAATTIETIRALPGSPAADLDDALARRLGVLNLRRLFGNRSALWVREVTVKRGDSVSRIAVENGSTQASLEKLNGGPVARVKVGQRLWVMNHPRFNLVVHRRARTADLSLNGKFFKRYDLQGDVTAKEGLYELADGRRAFWRGLGVRLAPADQAELDVLLPTRTQILISEM